MNRLLLSTVLLATLLGISACGGKSADADSHDHEHDSGGHHDDDAARGPHGGRLLASGEFALEVTIFEDGVAPEFRLYPMLHGKPLPASQVRASIELARINGLPGGQRDQHVFASRGDYLLSPLTVYEPHSFAVTLKAEHAGKRYKWTYDAPEGRTEINADMARINGVQTATVAPAALHESVSLYGSIRPDAGRVRAVTARFAGIVRSVSVQPGDAVKAGQTLATIESNESLQVYAVTAPIAGTITQRATNPGEAAGNATLFEVADFSRVWAELAVFPRDRARLKTGQPVRVTATDGAASGSGRIDYIAPSGNSAGNGTQALHARVVLDNGNGAWTPGQFVDARVTVGEIPAPVVVPLGALQNFRDWDVVFVVDGERYQAQPVELGRRDAQQVEVRSGLAPGARVVVGNSYLLKADIEKSGASHDH